MADLDGQIYERAGRWFSVVRSSELQSFRLFGVRHAASVWGVGCSEQTFAASEPEALLR
jgi:hypothetical protein